MVSLVLQHLSQWPCRKGRFPDEWPGDWRVDPENTESFLADFTALGHNVVGKPGLLI